MAMHSEIKSATKSHNIMLGKILLDFFNKYIYFGELQRKFFFFFFFFFFTKKLIFKRF